MCGIAGYISVENFSDENSLRHFVKCQSHRGPDASGIFTAPGAGLAHNRLSILDTSAKADQPFTSASGRYVMVYNGEVYNFKELQKKINAPLKTSSDTEIILELFEKEGPACVEQFRGMFSLVIYDKTEKCLWLMRDRFGIKPLYYYISKDAFYFSSELKALAELDGIKDKLSVNRKSIQHFLHLGFVPSASTIFNEIHSFPAASVGKVSEDAAFKHWKYWQPDYSVKEKTTFAGARSRIKELLFSSVEEHLLSDVPVGIFLSGGIDSSLLAAIASDIHPGKLKTFTIGMDGLKDEAPYAKKIASYLKTDHYEAYLSEEKAIELFSQVNDTYSEPFADSSAIPVMFVAELASRHVKVALSGEGADEIFLGYNSYNWASRLNNPLVKLAGTPLQSLLKGSMNPQLVKAARILSKLGTSYLSPEIYSAEHGFYSSEEVKKITGAEYPGFEYAKSDSGLTDQISFELEVALKDGLLVKMDRATMKYGLEARVPYLDHRLVEYSLSLDLNYRFKPNKHILKEILFELMPEKFFKRKKWGFGLKSNHGLKKYIQTAVPDLSHETELTKLIARSMLKNNQYLRSSDF